MFFLRKIGENIKKTVPSAILISGSLSTVLACMLPELHAVKVLFYAESVGMVTSCHVTNKAVTPFDRPLQRTPCYMQTSRCYLL